MSLFVYVPPTDELVDCSSLGQVVLGVMTIMPAFFIHVAVRLALKCVTEQEVLGHMVTLRNNRPSSELFGKDLLLRFYLCWQSRGQRRGV